MRGRSKPQRRVERGRAPRPPRGGRGTRRCLGGPPWWRCGGYLRRELPPERPPLERPPPPERPPLERLLLERLLLERLPPERAEDLLELLPPALRKPPEARLAPPREAEVPRAEELLREEDVLRDEDVPLDEELLREEDVPLDDELEERFNPRAEASDESPEPLRMESLARPAVLPCEASRFTLPAREVPPPPWARPWRSRRADAPVAGASEREANPAPPRRSTRGVRLLRDAGGSDREDREV